MLQKGYAVSGNHSDNGYSSHIRGVALAILGMGLSLAAVIVAWGTIGYQGSSYSVKAMEDQQEWLRDMYGLPEEEEITPEQLQTPPSLRNGSTVPADNATEDVRPT